MLDLEGFALKLLSPDNDTRVLHSLRSKVGFHNSRFSRFTFSVPTADPGRVSNHEWD